MLWQRWSTLYEAKFDQYFCRIKLSQEPTLLIGQYFHTLQIFKLTTEQGLFIFNLLKKELVLLTQHRLWVCVLSLYLKHSGLLNILMSRIFFFKSCLFFLEACLILLWIRIKSVSKTSSCCCKILLKNLFFTRFSSNTNQKIRLTYAQGSGVEPSSPLQQQLEWLQ